MRYVSLRGVCLVVAGCVAALSLAAQSMGREWSLGTLFKVEAELEAYDGKKARLRGTDGKVLTLPIEKLGEADQAYLKKTYPNGKERVGKSKDSPPKNSPDKPAATTAPAANPAPASTGDVKPKDLSVELISLTVVKPVGANVGLVPGTHATLLVSSESAPLLRVDAEKSKIVCADDRATNLSKPLPETKPTADDKSPADSGGLTLDVAADGKSGTIVFDFPRVPSAKATRIRLKGDLHLVCGSEQDPAPVVVPLTLIVSVGL